MLGYDCQIAKAILEAGYRPGLIWMEVNVEGELPDNFERAILGIYSICQTGYIDVDDIMFSSKNEKGENVLVQEQFEDTEIGDTWKTFGPNQEFKVLTGTTKEKFLRIHRSQGNVQKIEPLYTPKPPSSKIIRRQLTGSTFVSFPLVLPSIDSVTLPRPSKAVWDQLNSDIEAIDLKEQHINKEHVRLANIIKVWNVFQHFYPYFDLIDVDWEKELRIAIERNKIDENKKDHILTLKKMVAKLNDSHIGVHSNQPLFFPPFALEWIENQLVITATNKTSNNIQPGDVVTSINGIPVAEFWQSILLQSSGANLERKRYRGIYEILEGAQHDSISLTILGAKSPAFFTKNLTEEQFENMVDLKPKSAYFEPEEGIKYIDLTRISWSFLKANLKDLSASKGLLFDLRGYPQWGTSEIVQHFTKDTLVNMPNYSARTSYPDRERVEFVKKQPWFFPPKEPYIDVPRVFLTNVSAISYSESFLQLVSHNKLAPIVGSRTAGSTGNTNNIFLFGNIVIPWTGVKIKDQKGNRFHGIGVLPEHEVHRTMEGIKTGKDELFEYAIDLLVKQQK